MVVYLYSDNNNEVFILTLLIMKISTPFTASELKKELTSFGVKVLMCQATRNKNAVIAVEGSIKNVDLFISFCELNNYAGVCARSFRPVKTDVEYVNYGNIYKYVEA